ncbi:MAG: hypothetical protein Q9168_006708, partial [Polycauliona sp. 1 TL-2023]
KEEESAVVLSQASPQGNLANETDIFLPREKGEDPTTKEAELDGNVPKASVLKNLSSETDIFLP